MNSFLNVLSIFFFIILAIFSLNVSANQKELVEAILSSDKEKVKSILENPASLSEIDFKKLAPNPNTPGSELTPLGMAALVGRLGILKRDMPESCVITQKREGSVTLN